MERLKAWQPILTPKTVLPTFFIIGIIFAPIGGVLLWASSKVSEFTISYTDCEFTAPNTTFGDLPSSAYTYSVSGSSDIPIVAPQWTFTTTNDANTPARLRSVCTLRFTVPKTLDSSVFMYYKLTNYFQNHRRYVKSYNSDQLKGVAKSASDLNSDGLCKPLDQNAQGQPIYPCGLIANSVFNGNFACAIV
ncbi:alkylphosphocholine resistance protein lem3 [Cystobasidiomycetes sp. EMM_F5]